MSVEKMHAHLRSFSHRFIVKDPIVKHSMRVQRAFNNARGLPKGLLQIDPMKTLS